jgi:ATP-dependent Lhr-like helicase
MTRNCLFLATSERAMLKAAALLQLWSEGIVEPIIAPELPLHIFSQQLMALTLQLQGLGVVDWLTWIGRLPPFAALDAGTVGDIMRFLRERGILFEDSGTLGIGPEGEARFGRRHFLEILSVFTSPAMLTVFHAGRELGQVEAGFLVRTQEGAPARIALGGHSWLVREIDWRMRRVAVEPSAERGRGAWIGSGQGMSHTLAGAVKRIITSAGTPPNWSTRAQEAMERIRAEFSFVRPDGHTLAVAQNPARAEWFNFAGGVANDILANHLARRHGLLCEPSDLCISFSEGTNPEHFLSTLTALTVQEIEEHASFDDQAVEALKFHECLPPKVLQDVLRRRLVNRDAFNAVLATKTAIAVNANG